MREDYFIIWTHGLKYVEEIKELIKTEYNKQFLIYGSKEYSFKHTQFIDFLFKLYKKENRAHIIGKIRHLIEYIKTNKLIPKIYIIKFKNLNPKSRKFYNGPPKCEYVETLKIRLRNKYNPHFANKNKQIFPLKKGVSHNHIIHSSDDENDIIYLNSILY